ncbi:MAG TPA: histidine kinase [Candidatus Dormibacteraeota bacterium]|nr:histidine kinase [Candidatus Dormibacteraeota bacterium]
MNQVLDAIRDRALLRLDRTGLVLHCNEAAPKILGRAAPDLRGRHCSFLFDETDTGREKAGEALALAMSDGRYERRGWQVRGDGSHFWAEVRIAPLGGGGPALEYVAAIRDLTWPKRREDGLKAALDVSRAILAGLELGAAFQMVAERARALVDADAAEVRIVDASGTMLVLRGISERRGDQAPSSTVVPELPVRGSLCGAVFEAGRARLVGGPGAALRHPPGDPYGELSEVQQVIPGPTLMVPLRVRSRSLGVLTASNLTGRPSLERHDLQTMAAFANQVTLAIQQVRRRRDQERRVLIEERRRLGRDIHDGVIQSLYAVTLSLSVAIERAQDLRLQRQLAGMTAHVDAVIADLRGLVRELRSSGGGA